VAGVVSAGRATIGKRCGEVPRRVLGSGIDFSLEARQARTTAIVTSQSGILLILPFSKSDI
jgi:hypothetical protein